MTRYIARFLSIVLTGIFLVSLEYKMKLHVGWAPDFALFFLLAVAPYITLPELALADGILLTLLVPAPSFGAAQAMLVLLPFVSVFVFRSATRMFALMVILATPIFYFSTAPHAALAHPGILAALTAGNVLIGAFLFLFSRAAWRQRRTLAG